MFESRQFDDNYTAKTQRDNNIHIQDVNVVKNNFMKSIDLNLKVILFQSWFLICL